MEYVCGIRTAFTKDSVTAALASLEDAKLLGYSEPCPVLDVTGQAYDDKGKPIRFTRAIYRGDGFKLVMKNTHDQASRLAITPDS
jgi:DNA-binding GntR family transcriptional regulator